MPVALPTHPRPTLLRPFLQAPATWWPEPIPVLTEFDAENGTDGLTVTQANVPMIAAPVINGAGAVFQFAAVAAMEGTTLGYRMKALTTNQTYGRMGITSSQVQRFRGLFTPVSTTGSRPVATWRASTTQRVFMLGITTAGVLFVRNAANSAETAGPTLSFGSPYVILLNLAGGSTTTDGYYSLQVWDATTQLQVGSTLTSSTYNLTNQPSTFLEIGTGDSGAGEVEFYWDQLQFENDVRTPFDAFTADPGQSATVNLVTDTETAQPFARAKTKTLGLLADTETAQAITRAKLKAVGQATETDLAQGLAESKAKTLGQPSETDTARPITQPQITAAIGLVVETDTAQPVSRSHSRTVGQPAGSDLAQPVSHSKTKTATLVAETDTAQPLARGKSRALGLLTETDAAQPHSRAKTRTLGQVSETDTALLITSSGEIRVVINQVVETDAVTAIAKTKSKTVGLVVDVSAPQPLTLARSRILGQPSETDSLFTLTRTHTRTIGQASTIDATQTLSRVRRRLLGQAVEVDETLPFVPPVPPRDITVTAGPFSARRWATATAVRRWSASGTEERWT